MIRFKQRRRSGAGGSACPAATPHAPQAQGEHQCFAISARVRARACFGKCQPRGGRSVGWTPAASAQEAAEQQGAADPSTSPETTGEIVVTAQFRAQNLQDTPLAITAVDAASIQNRNLAAWWTWQRQRPT
jgi:hypothetical protein